MLPGQWGGRAGQDCAESLSDSSFIGSHSLPCTHCDIGHFVAWDNTFAQNTCTMTMGLLSVDECQKWHHR